MENLRQALKLLFLQKSPQEILGKWSKGGSADAEIDREDLRLRYSDDYRAFTLDQSDCAYQHLRNVWMHAPDNSVLHFAGRGAGADKQGTVFNVLLHFAGEVLLETNGAPVCRYEHLLRWNDLTACLGEDIFTTSFLAAKDELSGTKRQNYCWPVVIGHDNRALNELFRHEMSDLHFHLKGSSVNFDLNWMSLMNKTFGWSKTFGLLSRHQDSSPVYEENAGQMPLYLYVVKAAAIRVLLFDFLSRNKEIFSCPSEHWTGLQGLVWSILNAADITEVQYSARQLDDVIQSFRNTIGHRYRGTDGSELIPDYAITDRNTQYLQGIDRLLSVLSGERWLLYQIFRGIYAGKWSNRHLNSLFYAYLAIKTKFRAEIIQHNNRAGFDNFNIYEKRKSLFIPDGSVYDGLLAQLAVCEFLGQGKERFLEARVAPKHPGDTLKRAIRRIKLNVSRSHFIDKETARKIDGCYSLTMHFIKQKDPNPHSCNLHRCRQAKVRKKVHMEALAIRDTRLDTTFSQRGRIRGIDAANSEILARPEVFAQAFRFLRNELRTDTQYPNNLGMTYHVGEDFLDAVDGLRAVDEVLTFMGFHNGDRLGHAIVLGIDVRNYYAKRHNILIIPLQVLLDNVVWLYHKGQDLPRFCRVCRELEILYETTYQKVHGSDKNSNNISPSLWDYYQSWLLRGDNPEYYSGRSGFTASSGYWYAFDLNTTSDSMLARKNDIAQKLYYDYHYNRTVKERGSRTEQVSLSDELVAHIADVQEKMLCEIERQNICVECNPTSNLLIGQIEGYRHHPILRFHNHGLNLNLPPHAISVSINTDDKGIFATSLEREYSLLALALEKEFAKEKENPPRTIYEWLDQIRKMAAEQRFR